MSALLKPRLASKLPVVSHAKGVKIYDTAGRDYIDGSGGPMTVAIGHGVPEVIEAMQKQAEQVCFTYRSQFTSRSAEELAQMLAGLAPGDVNHVFFVNSGSEATELCMRTAIQYWRECGRPERTRVLGRKTSYHGMTMGALSMSGHDARRRDYAELLHPLAVGPDSHAWVDSDSRADRGGVESAEDWIAAIDQYGADKVAAIIVEPVIGAAGGAIVPPAGHLQKLRELCDARDILLITDEVITGIGRTGTWFASEHDDVIPDLIAIAKGMTAGYTPMGAVLMRDKVVAAMREGSGAAPFGHTFSGNPLSAATCLAVLRFMRDNDVLGNAKRRAPELEAGLRRLAQKYPVMANVRGKGMLWGFDVQRKGAAHAGLNGVFVQHCLDAGLVVYPAGFAPHDNAAIISPPLTITESELQELLARLDAALEAFSASK